MTTTSHTRTRWHRICDGVYRYGQTHYIAVKNDGSPVRAGQRWLVYSDSHGDTTDTCLTGATFCGHEDSREHCGYHMDMLIQQELAR
jgi:hypothetical protein